MLFSDEIDQIYQNHINNWQRRIAEDCVDEFEASNKN